MRAKLTKPADLLPRWRVSIIRKKAEDLGTVRAKDEPTAISKAMEIYGIDPYEERRLFARRID